MSSRFTRVAHEVVTCAIAPLSNSKVANTSSSTSTSYGAPASSMRLGICVTMRHDTAPAALQPRRQDAAEKSGVAHLAQLVEARQVHLVLHGGGLDARSFGGTH